MFIGQRLGNTLPAGLTFFVDASGSISVRVSAEVDEVVRYRILDPRTITVISNLDSGQQTVNVFTGEVDISLSTNCEPASGYIRERYNSSDITVISLVSAIAEVTKLASTDIGVTTSLTSDEVRERNESSNINATLNLTADAIRAIYAKASSSVTTNMDTAAVKVRIGRSDIIVTTSLDSDEVRERNNSSDITATLSVDQIEALKAIYGLASIDVRANVAEIDVMRERNVGADIEIETLVGAIGTLLTALFSYQGDIAPGDTIIIDTDDLTVEDASGDNLRKYFDGEWYEIDPDNTDSLTWLDSVIDRDIDITIEKEDRSI